MTKDKFRALVETAMESITRMPDELFEATAPMVRIRVYGSSETVLVGIEVPDEELDDC